MSNEALTWLFGAMAGFIALVISRMIKNQNAFNNGLEEKVNALEIKITLLL